MFKKFIKDESGVTAIEYGLIAAAVGLTIVAISPALSTALSTLFTTITSSLTNASAGGGG